jgi:hypothetical protein
MMASRLFGLLLVVWLAAPSTAQASDPESTGQSASPQAVVVFGTAVEVADASVQPSAPKPIQPERGALLPSLYVSLAGLSAFDAYATVAGSSRGALEANPALRGAAGNPAVMWAVKGAATAGTILLAEQLWRKGYRGRAVFVTIVSNGIAAAVAAHNARVLASH